MIYRGPSLLDSAAHPPPTILPSVSWTSDTPGETEKERQFADGRRGGGGRGAKSYDQREGKGLLEYHAMPSLRDVAHDRWLRTFTENSISSQLGSSCLGNRYGTEKEGGTARPSRTKSYLPGHSPPAKRVRRADVLGQPSSFRPHCICRPRKLFCPL
jgi:hypothetical protein